MNIVITGVAGFIGSSLAEKLLREGHEILGIDCMNDYYTIFFKQHNLSTLFRYPSFNFLQQDLTEITTHTLRNAELIFHLAGQPGVRNSWGSNFREYVHDNIEATQNLLECVRHSDSLKRLIYASTSSVYGDDNELPLRETATPHPISPYGVTKLTGEHLCATYGKTYAIPVVCLRYFTVYGPRQRPDMAFHRFFRAGLQGEKITIFGDGSQTRDFTYIEDIVRATRDAAFAEITRPFMIMNVGSGSRIPLHHIIDVIGGIMGNPLRVEYTGKENGDVRDTFADISRAGKILSYAPSTALADGLRAQYLWMRTNEKILFHSRRPLDGAKPETASPTGIR